MVQVSHTILYQNVIITDLISEVTWNTNLAILALQIASLFSGKHTAMYLSMVKTTTYLCRKQVELTIGVNVWG